MPCAATTSVKILECLPNTLGIQSRRLQLSVSNSKLKNIRTQGGREKVMVYHFSRCLKAVYFEKYDCARERLLFNATLQT